LKEGSGSVNAVFLGMLDVRWLTDRSTNVNLIVGFCGEIGNSL
jgi:hypothetical protein